MARIRTIKPEFWTDSKTGSLSGDATKLFLGMLNFSDDYGVLEMDLPALKAKIFPYSIGTPIAVIGKSLFDELLPKGLVVVFKMEAEDDEAHDPKPYFWIKNFSKHQRVDKPGVPLVKGFSESLAVHDHSINEKQV